jgi:hypothetical protein
MFDRPLSECLDRALSRLPDLCRNEPVAADALRSWMARLGPTDRARDYFGGGRAVMFLLPWWLESRVRGAPDIAFQGRLVESTISAYYAARLIDDVMDENAAEARALLPLVGVLHANFIRPYAELFGPSAPFWEYFDRFWSRTAAAAFRDKTSPSISADVFAEVAAQKTAGVKIPLAAVCCRHAREDLLPSWCAFYDVLAAWQQMADDTFDWVRDRQHGNATFFLSEGDRQKLAGESVPGWVVRRGLAWALAWLDDVMAELRRRAQGLDCPEVVRFLDYREAEVREHALEHGARLKELAALADAFEPGVVAGRSSRA